MNLFGPFQRLFFFSSKVGKEYNVGFFQKAILIAKFIKNTKRIPIASSWMEHLEMAKEILNVSSSVQGDVIECGSFMGGSTANLSLVCSIVKRKLVVCDSFQGLPEPSENDKHHELLYSATHINYEKGQYMPSSID